jgi:hypothetical protein
LPPPPRQIKYMEEHPLPPAPAPMAYYGGGASPGPPEAAKAPAWARPGEEAAGEAADPSKRRRGAALDEAGAGGAGGWGGGDGAGAGGGRATPPCRFWDGTEGSCQNGNACRFFHAPAPDRAAFPAAPHSATPGARARAPFSEGGAGEGAARTAAPAAPPSPFGARLGNPFGASPSGGGGPASGSTRQTGGAPASPLGAAVAPSASAPRSLFAEGGAAERGTEQAEAAPASPLLRSKTSAGGLFGLAAPEAPAAKPFASTFGATPAAPSAPGTPTVPSLWSAFGGGAAGGAPSPATNFSTMFARASGASEGTNPFAVPQRSADGGGGEHATGAACYVRRALSPRGATLPLPGSAASALGHR